MAALESTGTTLDFRPSACPHDCPSTCALEVERLDGRRIGRIRGAADNSYTAGVICAKVARYAERHHHPDRLTRPLRRKGAKGAGEWQTISWDAALDEVAENFRALAAKYGSETIWPYFYAGTMGLVQRDGINRLRHAMRYSGQYSTICTTLAWTGWIAGTGALMGADPREMANSDVVVIWGTNPVNTQINVMTHAVKARKNRAAKIVVVDPYRNGTALQADMHLCLRPGTDGALACAVMHVLFRDGYADRDYLKQYTDVPDELEAHLRTRDPAWAAAITGLDEAEITAFAHLLGQNKRSYLRLGYGFSRSRNGSINMHAAASIAAVTGSWRYKGGGAFHNNGAIFHWDRSLIDGLDVRDPSIRVLDQSRIGPVLTGDPQDLGDGPPVTGMLIQSTNPMTVAPDLAKVHAGFARDDLFVCVHEQFMTETAAVADIVLPATTFLEHDDVYQAGGQSHILMGAKVVEPLEGTRSNHEVICGLAERLGARHPGFSMSAREIVDATLKSSGWGDIETLEADRWIDCAPDFRAAHFLDGFGHPDGKFRFAPDWQRLDRQKRDIPRLPDHWTAIDEATERCPFRMVTAPSRNYLNTSFTETPTSIKREGRPSLMLHPDDAARLGLADGAIARIGNGRGSLRIHVEIFDGVQPGVVVVESVWPNGAFIDGMGINLLTGADSPAPVGGAAFHDTAIWVEADDRSA
ncbi:molybdopterin-containing oxidoreductase family protein [Oceanibacterium hippocampi]|uniref:Dimethyl sulfoxide reductase DmsA n=1 Tax=Oceanibacterium hippocampi TaxID=745714 RepID=A0A1Y5SHN6_9PROT|nr:molybdopterin oxidoreductase family protein [Oceanibacterium hippocampi]SLN40930.1 Dimethyl sulfoxide reductase DmsA precursor [Oceanibacterium hippocampi]